jgi:hypothetical protein
MASSRVLLTDERSSRPPFSSGARVSSVWSRAAGRPLKPSNATLDAIVGCPSAMSIVMSTFVCV